MNPLQAFQSKYNLVPDGILGKKTLRKMQTVLGITKESHLAHFAAQITHESGHFKYREENLNYSAEALRRVFGMSYTDALEYAYNPEAIANRVYANRMGNGDEKSGDGWKYRGRGALQLTGKNNYELFANKKRDLSILSNPEQVANEYYFDSAVHFFNVNHLWHLCDLVTNPSIVNLTKKINGGTNGLQERMELTYKYYRLLCA